MRRRELIILLGSAAAAWPLAARAQRKAMPVIGYLDQARLPSPDRPSGSLASFQRGLRELGYEEGRNYIIASRFADTDRSRLPTLAKDLVNLGVDIIVTIGTPPVHAAKAATTTIPIVMAGSNLPVESGLVVSLAHPGGNVTGLTHNAGAGIAGKGLQLLKEAAPAISRVAVLGMSDGPPSLSRGEATASNLTLLFHDVGNARSAADFGAILSEIKDKRADAVFIFPEFINDKYNAEILRIFIGK